MKIKKIVLLAITAICITSATNAQTNVQLKTQADSISYAIGQDIANSLKPLGFTFNVDALKAALDGMKDGKFLFTEEKKNELVQSLQAIMQQKEGVETAKKTEVAKAEGAKFLAGNKNKSGIKTTASGLQYEVVKEGTGRMPVATDKVTVHYTGKTLDGKVFDSSVERGEPIAFALNQVIPGWTEGVQLMKEGGKSIFYIPSDLAYGDQGAGGAIPPGATLVFEVELIKIGE